jgi:hypothetical protein
LEFGIWNFFGTWNLGFGASSRWCNPSSLLIIAESCHKLLGEKKDKRFYAAVENQTTRGAATTKVGTHNSIATTAENISIASSAPQLRAVLAERCQSSLLTQISLCMAMAIRCADPRPHLQPFRDPFQGHHHLEFVQTCALRLCI